MRLKNQSRNHNHIDLARRLRSTSGASEDVLWQRIRKDGLGCRFRRQVPILDYVLDFYCPESLLCVEVDGPHHATQQDTDGLRDLRLGALGIDTIRIPSEDLFTPTGAELANWLAEITRWCEKKTCRRAFPE